MPEKRAVIFANGEIKEKALVRGLLEARDWLIAADGGVYHILKLGRVPSLLIGDLDSTQPADIQRFEAQGVEIRRFPVDKNETDLDLAIQAALDAGYKRILLVAALGGRLDQTLGNLFLLTQPALEQVDIRMEDGRDEVLLIRKRAEIHGQPGDTISLLPINGPVHGITTTNLKYPLNSETLLPEKTRGISNRMLTAHAIVEISSGMLLCIHTRKFR